MRDNISSERSLTVVYWTASKSVSLLWQIQFPEDVNVVPYRFLRDLNMLTEGAFGLVYRAEHEDWGTVAYKELKTRVIGPESQSVAWLIARD